MKFEIYCDLILEINAHAPIFTSYVLESEISDYSNVFDDYNVESIDENQLRQKLRK